MFHTTSIPYRLILKIPAGTIRSFGVIFKVELYSLLCSCNFQETISLVRSCKQWDVLYICSFRAI